MLRARNASTALTVKDFIGILLLKMYFLLIQAEIFADMIGTRSGMQHKNKIEYLMKK
jgi:hypothetical protein